MKKQTYYHFILDQSGSMQDCIRPTISGYNEQLQLIRKLDTRYDDQELFLSLTRFNDEVMHTFFNKKPADAAMLTPELYQPDGSTALYDAIGSSILRLKEDIGGRLHDGTATVVVVILTDGYENASKYFSRDKISRMIKEAEATDNWTFSYLGATEDAVLMAETISIRRQNSIAFNKADMSRTMYSIADNMESYVAAKASGQKPADFLKSKR